MPVVTTAEYVVIMIAAWRLRPSGRGGNAASPPLKCRCAERAAAVIARIVAAVDVPVSADIEAGYEDVAATITAVLRAGAVGVNIEDRRDGSGLYAPAEQAARLAAARAAAGAAARAAAGGSPFWINARTDVFLGGTGRIDDALERSAAYAAAGADSLFVPGLVDPAGIAELAAGPLPVAVMVWPGAPTVAELAAAGAVRISLGSAIAQAAYGSPPAPPPSCSPAAPTTPSPTVSPTAR
jgi:2-methylisocitrate lyase-like PEP mutase family enzyme